MDTADELRVQRDVLEFRLVMLEQEIEAQRRREGMAAPELGEDMPALFDRLRLVNAKLAELRGPGGVT